LAKILVQRFTVAPVFSGFWAGTLGVLDNGEMFDPFPESPHPEL
jgi:hypothetical protein